MKNLNLLRISLLLLCAAHLANAASVGTAFTYQGRLAIGTNTLSGLYDFRFALWTDLSAGVQVGSTVSLLATPLSNGLFSVTLDFGPGIFNGDARWLNINVRTNGSGTYVTLSPRQPLDPAPYALWAGTTPTATYATTAGTVAANGVGNASLANGSVTAAKIASTQVVKSLNNLRDDVTLAAGPNTTLTPSGQTIAVSTPTDWHVGGNAGTIPGTDFLGTTDGQPFEIGVGGMRAFRLEPPANATDGPNVLAGYSGNYVLSNISGATIGGGGAAPTVWPGPPVQRTYYRNTVGANYGVVAGGLQNTVNGEQGVVGGGQGNLALSNGACAVIPGGDQNVADGANSLAAGHRAKARHTGSFVWADSGEADFASSGSNQFLVRATGGVGIGTTAPVRALQVADASGNNGSGGNIQVGALASNGDPKLIHFGDRQKNGMGAVYLGENGMDDRLEFRAAEFYFNYGKVGIGKTNPAAALDVVGTVRASAFEGDGSGLTFPAQTVFANAVGIGTTPQDARLDVEGNLRLNDYDLFLRGGVDRNHGLGWYGVLSGTNKYFANVNVDGPVLYGWSGGGLGAVNPSNQLALRWNAAGNVAIDPQGVNDGFISPGLTFGDGSGEGIASKRSATGNQYGLDLYTSFRPRLSIVNDGSIGIGATAPTAKLQVAGDLKVDGLASGDAADFYGRVRIHNHSTGAIVVELGEGLDYAEGFDLTDKEQASPGTVVVIDPQHPGQLSSSRAAYDRKVAGIIAAAQGMGSGVRLGTGRFDRDVALAGRVYCKVDGAYGAVVPGDLLTTSPTPGHAMAVKDFARAQGAILGKAMQSLAEGEKGQILVLVTLQ